MWTNRKPEVIKMPELRIALQRYHDYYVSRFNEGNLPDIDRTHYNQAIALEAEGAVVKHTSDPSASDSIDCVLTGRITELEST